VEPSHVVNKIEDEFNKGVKYFRDSNYSQASSAFQYCLEFAKVHNLNLNSNLSCNIHYYLALSSESQKKVDREIHYRTALDLTDDPKMKATILTNYAAFLASLDNNEKAIENAKMALEILSSQDSSFNYTTPAIHGNIAGYYIALGDLEGAADNARQSYQIFLKNLGKYNDYTKAAFENYCYILKRNDKQDQLNEEKKIWENYNEEIVVQGLDAKELKLISLQAFVTLKKTTPCEPEGLTKGQVISKRELNQFVTTWADKFGIETAFLPVIKQEIESLMSSRRTRNNAANATLARYSHINTDLLMEYEIALYKENRDRDTTLETLDKEKKYQWARAETLGLDPYELFDVYESEIKHEGKHDADRLREIIDLRSKNLLRDARPPPPISTTEKAKKVSLVNIIASKNKEGTKESKESKPGKSKEGTNSQPLIKIISDSQDYATSKKGKRKKLIPMAVLADGDKNLNSVYDFSIWGRRLD
jgi:tetratricopeptide (TPR) repeat protein